ncbi:hypothetical protein [Sinomonas humi]|uniref:SRPBCC family protein n=1 Tax=Sinomonas humi TaxID=1338436 RepID=A0A0B2AQD0_9MICC|nr:hypothetical protein [Sinomonas humi]KHL04028.1 hypothetical protein LK10_07205 [Sinomonas humi]
MPGRLRHFELRLETPLPAPIAWARILDLRAHDRLIPFTHIIEGLASADELRPGHRFVACTLLTRVGFRGRLLGFNDVMTFEEIEPPEEAHAGHARIVKSGKLVRGSIEVTVSPGRGDGAGRNENRPTPGSTVRWSQDFGLARFPGIVGLAAFAVAGPAYWVTLKRLLRG